MTCTQAKSGNLQHSGARPPSSFPCYKVIIGPVFKVVHVLELNMPLVRVEYVPTELRTG